MGGSPESLDFLRAAKQRTVRTSDGAPRGFVVGESSTGDVLIAASLLTPPGEYALTVSAVNEAGEERSTPLSVTLTPPKTVPSNATRPPVVLLNGWRIGFLSSCPISIDSGGTFGSLESDLANDGVPVVYFFDNCVEDANAPIEELGNVLGQFLALIKYDTGAVVPQVDLVGHSMGGLIVRSYFAGLHSDGSLSTPVDPKVRKLVQVATPNFGSFLASAAPGTQAAEMVPGSPFLWNLATWNLRGDDLRGVDALAVIGNAGYEATLAISPPDLASDGVVSLSSASLGFARDSTRTRILPYCHSDFGIAEQVFVDCRGAGIAAAPETNAIIRSFFAGSTIWQSIGTTPQQDRWLKSYGGMYVADLTASNQYLGDISTASFGTVPLTRGGASGIFYGDLVSGRDTFHLASKSQGTLNCGPVTEAAGYYTAFRCKASPLVSSVSPLLANTNAWVVRSGGILAIAGAGFGSSKCSACSVVAYPGPVILAISSWTDSSITVTMPASFNGIALIVVQTSTGSDSISFVARPQPSPPSIVLSSTQLQFSYITGGAPPATQRVTVSNGGDGSLSWSASANFPWIVAAASLSSLTLAIDPTGLAVGTYRGSVSVAAPGATNSPQTIAVTLTVAGIAGPTVIVSSVINAASGAAGAVAPGELVTIKGSGLGPPIGLSFSVDSISGTVSSTLAGTRVFFGPFAAPITYTSAGQINAIAPYEIAGQAQVTIQVQYQGGTSAGVVVPVASAAPGIFTLGSTGSGQALAANQDGTLNGPSAPAPRSSYLTIYFTGGGQTNPPGATGGVTGSVLKWLVQPVSVTVGGVSATVSFDGAAPTFVDGLNQLNIQLGNGTPSGTSLPVILTVGGRASPSSATLAVQ